MRQQRRLDRNFGRHGHHDQSVGTLTPTERGDDRGGDRGGNEPGDDHGGHSGPG